MNSDQEFHELLGEFLLTVKHVIDHMAFRMQTGASVINEYHVFIYFYLLITPQHYDNMECRNSVSYIMQSFKMFNIGSFFFIILGKKSSFKVVSNNRKTWKHQTNLR